MMVSLKGGTITLFNRRLSILSRNGDISNWFTEIFGLLRNEIFVLFWTPFSSLRCLRNNWEESFNRIQAACISDPYHTVLIHRNAWTLCNRPGKVKNQVPSFTKFDNEDQTFQLLVIKFKFYMSLRSWRIRLIGH